MKEEHKDKLKDYCISDKSLKKANRVGQAYMLDMGDHFMFPGSKTIYVVEGIERNWHDKTQVKEVQARQKNEKFSDTLRRLPEHEYVIFLRC